MATTVTYKGETLTTVDNATKVLQTAGTWLEDDLTLVDVSGGGGSGPISLLETITVPVDTRAINIGITDYSGYNVLIITEDITLDSADWLYYVRNGSTPSGGNYNDGSKATHTGIMLWRLPLGGSAKVQLGFVSAGNFDQVNDYSGNGTPNTTNVYVYTYKANNVIKAGSTFKIYGGHYADL